MEPITIGGEPTDDDYEAEERSSGFHALTCSTRWAITGAWLGRRTNVCAVCGQMYKVCRGDG
jgi:hypothetical protein